MWYYGSVIDWGFLDRAAYPRAGFPTAAFRGQGPKGRGTPRDWADGAGWQWCERMAGAEALPDCVSAFCQQQRLTKLSAAVLKSLCRIVKTLSASQLVCSYLYQLPAPAPNFCLSTWVSIPFVITFPAGVLKWTWDAGDGNTFPAASAAARRCDPHAGRAYGHGDKCPLRRLSRSW